MIFGDFPAVPLTPIHPAEMLKYFIADSGSKLIICLQDYEKILRPVSEELSKPLLVVYRPKDGKEEDEKAEQGNDSQDKDDQGKVQDDVMRDIGPSNMWYGGTEAMLIYTSGKC